MADALSPKTSRGSRGRRVLRALLMVLIPVVMATGCTITTTIGIGYPRYTLTGSALFGYRDLRLDDATVTINGPTYRTVYTDVNGTFSAGDLPEGNYTVTLSSMAGSVTQKVSLTEDTSVILRVPYPGWTSNDERKFLLISGLWDCYVDNYNNLKITTGIGNWRWRLDNSNVPIYIDNKNTPIGYDPRWADEVWQYIGDWPSIVDYRVGTYRATSAGPEGIEIAWVPRGSLGSGVAGSATVVRWDSLGYLDKVLVLVDVAYGDILNSAVMGHEVLHSIGANHVDSPTTSVLYPWVSDGQAIILSKEERYFLKYAFAVAPNQSVPYTGIAAADLGTSPSASTATRMMSASTVMTIFNTPNKPPQVMKGVPQELMKHKRVQELFGGAGGKIPGGFLWDDIGK